MSRTILEPREYAMNHKSAFRTAFDFLNAHFPPENTDVWWKPVAEEGSAIVAEHQDNPLLEQLMVAVFNYLGDESRLRRIDDGSAEG